MGSSQAFEVCYFKKLNHACLIIDAACQKQVLNIFVSVVLSVFCFSTRLFLSAMFLVFQSSVYSKPLDEEPSNLKLGGR